MAPLVHELKANSQFVVKVCVTAQHRQMLDQVLTLFKIQPDFDLNLMKQKQDLTDITVNVLSRMREVLQQWRPNLVLVHGDTTTTFAASLAAYYEKVAVGHVEAGLRTGNIYSPFPEEMNRKLAGSIASLHFAPTEESRQNLLREGVNSKNIFVTGNTVIDALLQVRDRLENERALVASFSNELPKLDANKKMILVTCHRRENFGLGIQNVCQAVKRLATRPDVEVVFPVHLNPNVQEPVHKILGGLPNVHLIAPQEYLPFVYLLNKSHIILTDSGGVQEESPSLGKPVLVLRDTSERPEAIAAGSVRLVGTNEDAIVKDSTELLDNAVAYKKMASVKNPYGDGRACKYIGDIIAAHNELVKM